MRRTLPTVAAVALTAVLGACTSSNVNTTPAANQVQTSAAGHTSSAAGPASSTNSSAAKKAGVGNTISIKGHQDGDALEVTLVKVVDPAPSKDEFTTPAAGKRFVAVQFKVVNKGRKVYSDDPQADITAKNAQGETMELSFGGTGAGADMPSSVNLTPGDQALGYVAFSVPTGQKITQVQYTLAGLDDHVAQWTIG
jgi:hypothetical protein